MRYILAAALVVFALLSFRGAQAEPIIIDMADDRVDITTGFGGAHLALYGVRKERGDIAVVLEGPRKDVAVRKKAKTFGLWMNRDEVIYKDVPVYYDFAMMPSDDEEPVAERLAGVNSIQFETDETEIKGEALKAFQKAYIRGQKAQRLYPRNPKQVKFIDRNFFKTDFYIPASVKPGLYKVHTLLIRGSQIVDKKTIELKVEQVGFSAAVFELARSHAFLYGLMCVCIALFSGWAINMIRR